MITKSILAPGNYMFLVILTCSIVSPNQIEAGTASDISVQYLRTILNPEPRSGAAMGARPTFVSETEVLLGARGDSFSGTNSGRAFLFDALSGSFISSYENPDPDSGDNFGLNGVSVGPNLIAISAHGDDATSSDAGSVYIFEKGTSDLVETLVSPNPTDSGNFGIYLSSVDGQLLIAATGDKIDGVSSGAVYLMDPETGALIRSYESPSPIAGDRFGVSLTTNGEFVLIGSDLKNDGSFADSGVAHVFDFRTGAHLHTLENPSPGNGDRFGSSVTIVGSLAVIGASKDDTVGENAGAVYVFDLATGTFERSLHSPDAEPYEDFGNVCGVNERVVVVGAASSSFEGRFLEGRAYLFDPFTGEHLHTLLNPAAEPDDYFGSGCGTFENLCVIGSFGDDRGGNNVGSALVFRLQNLPPKPTPTPAMEEEGVVAGFVTNASDLQIITQAILALDDRIEFPDEDGVFIFEDIEQGSAVLDAVAPGFEAYSMSIEVDGATLLLIEMFPRGMNPNADVNFDGVVNQMDYFEVQKNWHRRFPGHKYTPNKEPEGDRRKELLEILRGYLKKMEG